MKIFKKLPLLAILIMILILSAAAAGVAAEKEEESPLAATDPQITSLFSDVAANDNNVLFINYLADRKIISGYPDGSYHPQEGLTRAQAAVVLVKAANLKATAANETGFVDVKAEHWAAANIAAAAKAGYLKGYPDGSFHPDEKLTRAQGVALVMRLSTQKERPQLPELKDLDQSHWAAGDMALALAAGMVGLSNNHTQINPELVMSRGSLARALGTLLTKDPDLYLQQMAGTIKDVKGEVKLTRQGAGSFLKNDDQVYAGDIISSTANSSASIYYPDGSSILIKENTEIIVKESIGRNCIKSDGSSGVAVDNVDFDLKKGTLFGALATKHGAEETQQAQAGEILLAGLEGLGYIADNSNSKIPPWYQQAESKKVKMKVDMPYGVASVRGTYILVSIQSDGTATVGCLTGDAEVEGNSGKYTALAAGLSSTVGQGGNATDAVPMSEKEKQEFKAAQQWVVDTALGIDKNKEGIVPPVVEMLIEIPDQALTPAQQAESLKNTIEVVLDALNSSGIELSEQVKKDLEQKLEETQQGLSQKLLENNQSNNQNTVPSGGGGASDEGSSVSYINYAAAGTYGPESSANPQILSKNVIIGASGVTLQNMVIYRDLILAASIGDGSVTLKNVEVQGNTFVLGGGPNSVVLEDCELYTVTVDNETNTVRIVAKGNTAVGALTLNSGAKLEESDISGSGFSSVTTGPSIPDGATVILSGNFTAVNIEAPGLKIDVASGTIGEINLSSAATDVALNLGSGVSVSSLQVNAPVEIKGAGQIVSAVIKSSGVVIEKQPLSWTVIGENITANIGNQSVFGSGGVSTNAKLSSLSLSSGMLSPSFNANILEYSAALGYEVESIRITPAADSSASILVDGQSVASGSESQIIDLLVGSRNISIEVTAEDGTQKIYVLSLTRAANPAKAITAFVFDGLTPAISGSIDEGAKTVALTVPFGTNVTNLVPSITHSGVSLSPASGVPRNFSTPVSYRVTAADNSTQDYMVTVSVAEAQTGSIAGYVVNASDNTYVPGMTISFRDSTETVVATVYSDDSGAYSVSNLEAGTYNGYVSGTGFIDATFTVTCVAGITSNKNVVVSPIMSQGETRIVLTWGTAPDDLDSHLTGPRVEQGRFEVYYGNKSYSDSGTLVNLDVDDTDTGGPETTTIINQQASGDYIFSVHNYSRAFNFNAVNLYGSNAKVEVYSGGQNTAIATYNVPTEVQNGVWWTVFKLNGNTITPINYISDTFEATGAPAPGIPSVAASGLNFTDNDTTAGEMGGTLSWTPPADVSNVSHYVIYPSLDGSNKGGSLGEVAVGTNSFTIADNTTFAPYLMIYAKNATGEASAGASLEITDLVGGATGSIQLENADGQSVASYQVGDLVYVRVADDDLNNPVSIDNVTVSLQNNNNNDSINLTLAETGVNTGVFLGNARLKKDTSQDNMHLHGAVGETITATYNDAQNAAGDPSTLCDSATVVKGITGVISAVYESVEFKVNITLYDADLNTNSGSIQNVCVIVKSIKDSQGFDLTLTETGVNTGIFAGTLTIAAETNYSTTPPQLGVNSNDIITVTYEDELNDNGVSETITGTVQWPPAQMPLY